MTDHPLVPEENPSTESDEAAAPTPNPLDPDAVTQEVARQLLDPVNSVVRGQRVVVRQIVTTLLAGGHALVEGVPGTGKTLAVRALAQSLGLRFGRIQFTPDLMPADLVGVNVLDRGRSEFIWREGPVFTDLLLADEINRAPAKTQSALLEAMEERQVTVDGSSRRLSRAFTVFATQNPVEYEGTYPLPEAQLDRFLMKIVVDYPEEEAEQAILEEYAAGFRSSDVETFGMGARMTPEELAGHRAGVDAVHTDERIRGWITTVVRATREDPMFALGASPRAGVALFMAARAEAYLSGRDFVTPDDVKRMAFPVLRHRVVLTPDAAVEGREADQELRQLLQTLEAPR